jgi:hypothetical protein
MKNHRVRKDLLNLDKIELQALNDGFEALVAIEGHGGYQHIAGVYGKPGQAYRPTTPYLFLPWHRAYLMAFEQMLDHAWPGVTLPYWDWTGGATCKNGIPTRLRSVAYSDKDQGIWLNALCRAPIDCIGHQSYTERAPGKPAELEPTIQKVKEACLRTCFEDFSDELEHASFALGLAVTSKMTTLLPMIRSSGFTTQTWIGSGPTGSRRTRTRFRSGSLPSQWNPSQ